MIDNELRRVLGYFVYGPFTPDNISPQYKLAFTEVGQGNTRTRRVDYTTRNRSHAFNTTTGYELFMLSEDFAGVPGRLDASGWSHNQILSNGGTRVGILSLRVPEEASKYFQRRSPSRAYNPCALKWAILVVALAGAGYYLYHRKK